MQYKKLFYKAFKGLFQNALTWCIKYTTYLKFHKHRITSW